MNKRQQLSLTNNQGKILKSMSIQIENRLTQYVPNLNISQQVLQEQLGALINSERELLKADILVGKSGFTACTTHTQIWDAIIQKVYEVATYQIKTEYSKQIEELLKIPGVDYSDFMDDVQRIGLPMWLFTVSGVMAGMSYAIFLMWMSSIHHLLTLRMYMTKARLNLSDGSTTFLIVCI